MQSNDGVDLLISFPLISVNSSPPIIIHSSSMHIINLSSRSSRASDEALLQENTNYEIVLLIDILVLIDKDKDKDKNKEKQ